MKLYAVKHQPTGGWVISVKLHTGRFDRSNGEQDPIVLAEKPDVRCFRTPRSARTLLRSTRRNSEWLRSRSEVDPKDLVMVEVDAVIDFNSVKRVRLPEESRSG
jgi:hypothetical protein